MFSFFNKKIRFAVRSGRWSSVRKNFLKKNNTCAACGTNKGLEVHHIEPVHINPDKELDENNLIALCSGKCHLLFGHLMHFKSWNPDVEEDCKEMLQKIKKRN